MLILASASPRRHEILQAAGIAHTVQAVPVPEIRGHDEAPQSFVIRLAEEKARAVSVPGNAVVLAADTIVVIDEQVFGKPLDTGDAERMLRALSGRRHWVYTGICLLAGARCVVELAATQVEFVALSEQEIREYVQTGEPLDKAGAYAIQGLASKFVRCIDGCYQNVVGLPVSLVYQHLKRL